MDTKIVRIGTRGSELALVQTEAVVRALRENFPDIQVVTRVITTQGDTDLSAIPLDTIGKAWFTKEIEQALLSNEIDIAVHSLKDLPVEIPEGLSIAPALKRSDPRDVLISESGASLKNIPKGSIVGTDSIRRKAQILACRPDVIVESIRGNVGTRLEKLKHDRYNALVIAAAGLERLGILDCATEFLDPTEFVPAVGQGTLATEFRSDDTDIQQMITALQNPDTTSTAEAERAFSKRVGGGCKMPVACYARIEGNEVVLTGMLGSLDATETAYKTIRGKTEDAQELAIELAEALLRKNVLILHA